VSAYAMLVFLFFFTTLLCITEAANEAVLNQLTYAQRFANVPYALSYDLVLLSGDYPLTDFTFGGKVINFLQVLVAVGVVGVPSGLIASGFIAVLEKEREKRLERRKRAATTLQRNFRSLLARRRLYRTVEAHFANRLQDKKEEATMKRANSSKLQALDLVEGRSVVGRCTRSFMLLLIITNVMVVVIESEKTIYQAHPSFFELFEVISVVCFTVDYLLRVYSASVNRSYRCSTFAYLTSFYGVVDLISIAPWYIEVIMSLCGLPLDTAAMRMFRLFRLFQIEHFVEAFTLLDDVVMHCKGTLAATGLLALIIWVGAATLFYLFESSNPLLGDRFKDIPSSLYYVAIFLGGEWAATDFSIPGKVLCMFMVVVGIALFAIPVGTIFEAFSEVLAEGKDENNDESEKASDTTPLLASKGQGYGGYGGVGV